MATQRQNYTDAMLVELSARAWTPPAYAATKPLEQASADAWTPPPSPVMDRADATLVELSAAAWTGPAGAQGRGGALAARIPLVVEGDPFPFAAEAQVRVPRVTKYARLMASFVALRLAPSAPGRSRRA